MEISPVRNYNYMKSTAETAAEKKSTDAGMSVATDKYGKDTVEISADASLKSELSTYTKTLVSKNLEGASQERIAELTEKYKGDKCPVSSSTIAAAILRYSFGTQTRE